MAKFHREKNALNNKSDQLEFLRPTGEARDEEQKYALPVSPFPETLPQIVFNKIRFTHKCF